MPLTSNNSLSSFFAGQDGWLRSCFPDQILGAGSFFSLVMREASLISFVAEPSQISEVLPYMDENVSSRRERHHVLLLLIALLRKEDLFTPAASWYTVLSPSKPLLPSLARCSRNLFPSPRGPPGCLSEAKEVFSCRRFASYPRAPTLY